LNNYFIGNSQVYRKEDPEQKIESERRNRWNEHFIIDGASIVQGIPF